MLILICAALPSELKIIKEEIKKSNFRWWKIDFLLTWVWVLNASYAIKNYISEKKKPDFIVNIWVCGKITSKWGDFFQVYRIKNISNNREVICPIYVHIFWLESLACSDKIITNTPELWEEIFVDMESFWIDFICEKEKIPYVLIKKPFDRVSKGSKNVSLQDLENTLSEWLDGENIINKIVDFLEKNKKNIFIEEKVLAIKEKFQLTFSETEFLKKYINKEIAFHSDIKKILESFLSAEKKDILKKIKE